MTSSDAARPRALWALTALGAAGVIAAYFAAPRERFWANWVFWFLALATVGLGCLFIVALEHLVNSRWSVPIRRTPERLASLVIPSAAAGLLALFSLPVLYPWARPGEALPEVVLRKAAWLNIPFFSARALACFALWCLFYRLLVGASLRQDETADPAVTVRLRRLAPVFMAVFAITLTLVAFDWISSLEPSWYSDMFGVYAFAGAFMAGLAATTLGVIHLKERGRLEGVLGDHLYSLGGYLFAFTVFWGYIGFAQYMLIWYGDMPEEVFWFKERTEGPWLALALALGLFRFVVPFFALITRDAKEDPRVLKAMALLVLAGQLLDLYWMVFPAISKRPLFSWPEVSFALFFLGGALLWVRRAMATGRDMPVGDPFLKEGLEFRL